MSFFRSKIWEVVHFIWASIALAVSCFAGTPQQIAHARVAVALAQLEVADSRAELPDKPPQEAVGESIGDLTPLTEKEFADLEKQLKLSREELAEKTKTASAQAFEIAELKIGAAAVKRAVTPNIVDSLPLEPMRLEYVEPVGAMPSMPKIHTVTVCANWCVPCRNQKQANNDGNAKVSHEYIDVSEVDESGLSEAYRMSGGTLPLTCWRDAVGTTRYVTGFMTTDQIWQRIQRNNPPTPNAYGATLGKFRLHGRATIRQVIDNIDRYVGQGHRITFALDRSGKDRISILKKGEITGKSLLGTAGHFNVSCPSANFPVKELGLSYRFDGRDALISFDQLRVSGFLDRLAPQRGYGSSPLISQLFVLDDLLYGYSVIQLVQFLKGFFTPELELVLPEELSATMWLTDRTINVELTKPPTVHYREILSGDVIPKKVTITDRNIHLNNSCKWYLRRWYQDIDVPVVD